MLEKVSQTTTAAIEAALVARGMLNGKLASLTDGRGNVTAYAGACPRA